MRNFMRKNAWAVMALACTLSGCGGQASPNTGNETATDSTLDHPSDVRTIQTGSVTATWIQDNAGEKLMPRTLFAQAPDALIDSLSLQNGIPSTVSTFWVETQGIRILFDTGLGAPDSRLLPCLESLGVSPADVRYVFLTHFHGDHIGGLMKGDSVAFPQAEIHAARTEYDAWMKMPEGQKNQVAKTMEAYQDRLHLFEFGDTLPGGVVALEATGHTPGHTVFQAGKLLVVGDLMHGVALQKEHPEICASYDMETETAIATRKRILQYARDNHLTMAGMHFPAPAFITE